MQRRDFLGLLLSTSLLAVAGRASAAPRIGIALGGGGAKGLAHIPILELLDEAGLRPHRIAGTSIGAIIGVLYASGMKGQDIRELLNRLTVSKEESWFESLFSEDLGRWLDFAEFGVGNGGLADSSGLIAYLHEYIGAERFEQLAIPLSVVATDFWSREQVVLQSGELWSALKASIAIPGLFEPVQREGRLLVDGGLVNPVPYDLLFDECDLVIAVDVLGERTAESAEGPGYFETIFNTFQIMQHSIMREKLRQREPDIYLKPAIENVRVLEFYKIDEIYAQAQGEKERLKRLIRRDISPSIR
ncbi:MAG: patatin-like phospholipase family protein [Gammaproteobacteria bacterium]|nr:patatin-like phospholipase family protein [Gammaproteobacteria bacterium]MCW8841519.1 patatin-like phospholipase family protein [Gammaproteobacteria bacterium]MCW8927377.1 patatin-like phospholipase family protein [Gammaproteobacteria bacterium]MCW8958217.1 patatin-like phospholipase family protein [Gammaproteobacteria bacterium]MCW8973672.1 patatin-like phospholipase family protein [Gammaproteobacteria bacterium]